MGKLIESHNERGAGRKAKLTNEAWQELKQRNEQGESMTALAAEFGISRQAIYKRLQEEQQSEGDTVSDWVTLDYMVNDACGTRIFIETAHRRIRIENYVAELSQRAFGWKENPSWEDLEDLVEREWFRMQSPSVEKKFYAFSKGTAEYRVSELKETLHCKEDLPKFTFRRGELLIIRTDTDGYQMKAVSKDRKWFVKGQASIGGKWMKDWIVELVACDLARQLGMPCVWQEPCEFVYEGQSMHGVFSRNFELDGYSFVSFEQLLIRAHKSTHDSEYISLPATAKLKWCAEIMAEMGHLPKEETLKYMLDLAVLDCLVGNVDRHTRNFGLFYQVQTGEFSIPLIFDNGMGLFCHDSYHDACSSFEEAMRTVYVAPYGEDPLEFLEILNQEFDLLRLYPGISKLVYPPKWMAALGDLYADTYVQEVQKLWQK